MQEARQILANAGIKVDEAANGVWLPMQKMINDYQAAGKANWLDGVGIPHENIHTPVYKNAVLQRLRAVQGQSANVIRDELQSIAKELVEGTFPW